MDLDTPDGSKDQLRTLIDGLKHPVSDFQTLLSLLTPPLDVLGLLLPRFHRQNTKLSSLNAVDVLKYIPLLQDTILEYILPAWDTVLSENNAMALVEQYYSPNIFSGANPNSGAVASCAYSTILSRTLSDYSLTLLINLSSQYPIDRLYHAVFGIDVGAGSEAARKNVTWEDCVKNVIMVPMKVANMLGEMKKEIPHPLQYGPYMNEVCKRCEYLVYELSMRGTGKEATQPLLYLFTKLVNVGAFPIHQPAASSQPSFFQLTLPVIGSRLSEHTLTTDSAYAKFWQSLFSSFGSSMTLRSILISLLNSIDPVTATDGSEMQRVQAKNKGKMLTDLVGKLDPSKQEIWETALGVIIGREWKEGYARIIVCWVCGSEKDGRKANERVLETFLNSVLVAWSTPDHIKHSLLSHHRYLSSLLLLTVAALPPSAQAVQSLAFSPTFIGGIGKYISHHDTDVRRCGMLVAEVVAHLSGKKLDFGGWEGDSSIFIWAGAMRELIKKRDIDVDSGVLEREMPLNTTKHEILKRGSSPPIEVATQGAKENPTMLHRVAFAPVNAGYDSDDSLIGYAASPASSRSASPTPSELDAIEKDPTLNVGVKKVPRPVYLAQLGSLLRRTGDPSMEDGPHEADKIEMAINVAEELIRKKAGYGTELEENAVNLAYGLMGLQNTYELEGFEQKRQNALNALVTCSPRQAAPAIIEEFFKNQYSTTQRFAALTALAVGSRELASLPVPQSSKLLPGRISFPSKRLPEKLHRQFIAAEEHNRDLVPMLMDTISRAAIDRGRDSGPDQVPTLVRERKLRVGGVSSRGISELGSSSVSSVPCRASDYPKPTIQFVQVATEYFIIPLINRFWLFLRDEQTREERTMHLESRYRYVGAGTGLILNPLVLSQFLGTLAVLVNASQHAPEWLSVVAPDALELAVTIGSRPVSQMETEQGIEETSPRDQQKKEASVLTGTLELSLVVLDAALQLDLGRSLALEHTSLVLGVADWARTTFAMLEKGVRTPGEGGAHELKLNRAAAAVLLKVDEVMSRWRRSMINL